MSEAPAFVLDASALLAYLQGEPGASVVASALVQGAALRAVNWAEVLSKLAERSQDPDTVATYVTYSRRYPSTVQRWLLEFALKKFPGSFGIT